MVVDVSSHASHDIAGSLCIVLNDPFELRHFCHSANFDSVTVKAARVRHGFNGMLGRCGIKYSGNGGGLHYKVAKETKDGGEQMKGRNKLK